ncbi:MAG TPA: GNAT family N-acetyltransferase [Candidatus Polarisedimenticolia bacterium]|nr:GNAT family N-acetyltransferase [Candidatus Polarisedimenticolia bacterium]
MPIPTIETERLRLRAFRDGDREPFAELNADREVMELFPAVLSRRESDAFLDRILRRWDEDGHGLWAIELKTDGAFFGFAGLATHRFEAHFMPAVEVGWRLARHAWGFGYATEAGAAALRYGFETLGLEEIVSFTTVANARSRRVMERLGMTRDPADDFDHPNLPVGHPIRPHVLYRLPKAAWLAGQVNGAAG